MACPPIPYCLGKPLLHLSRELVGSVDEAGEQLRAFVEQHAARRLNIAGPRASHNPEVGQFVDAVLTAAFGPESKFPKKGNRDWPV